MKKPKNLFVPMLFFIFGGLISLGFYDEGFVLNELWKSNYVVTICKFLNQELINVSKYIYLSFMIVGVGLLVISLICTKYAKGNSSDLKRNLLFLGCFTVLMYFVTAILLKVFNMSSKAFLLSSIFFGYGLLLLMVLCLVVLVLRFLAKVLFSKLKNNYSYLDEAAIVFLVIAVGLLGVLYYDDTSIIPSVFKKINPVQMVVTSVLKKDLINLSGMTLLVFIAVMAVLFVVYVIMRLVSVNKEKKSQKNISIILAAIFVVALLVLRFALGNEFAVATKVFVWSALLTSLVVALGIYLLRCFNKSIFGNVEEDTNQPKEETTPEETEPEEETTPEETEVKEETTPEETEVEEETTPEETKVEEETTPEETEVEEELTEDDSDSEETNDVVVSPIIIDNEEYEEVTTYSRGLTAKLIGSADEVKEQYNQIMNLINKYDDVSTRNSWTTLSVNKSRTKLLKICMTGKKISVFMALDPKDYENSKYHLQNKSDVKKYADTPMRIRVSSPRALKYTLELIATVFDNHDVFLKDKEPKAVDYKKELKSRSDEKLIAEGLVKVKTTQRKIVK